MKTDVKLAVLSAAELGVESDESSLSDVYERARRVGLELCPAEVGLQLRLEYRNQPLGEALDIAMEPVATYSGDPTILTLANWGILPLKRRPTTWPSASHAGCCGANDQAQRGGQPQ
jgi:hypothetical protein